MINRKKYSLIAIAVSILFITYLHYSAMPGIHALHDLYLEFYYLPILLGALAFGLKGALLTFFLIATLYLPHALMIWTGTFLLEVNKLLHILLQGLFAIFAGYLVDRDRRQRELMEKERYLSEIGRVASEIVHDLKGPLIAILGFAERIKAGRGKTDTAVRTIINSAEQMQKIINSVLEYGKPVQLAYEEEDIMNVIRRSCDVCGVKAEQKGVQISVGLPPDPFVMMLDCIYLERAMVNIILNAVEVSGKGQVVSITAAVGENTIYVRIKDQGAGMDSETSHNMFMPFFTKKSGGTGLGMPIAKKIIDAHHGKIHIDSRPGSGTEVTIEMPYKRGDEA